MRTVAARESLLAPAITRRLVERFVRTRVRGGATQQERFAELTERELEVLVYVARGLSNAEIAEQLFVSEATVKTHVNQVFAKTGVRDRAQLVGYAFRTGLAAPHPG
jgi:DNA-binding NarL/FixJ family response regulator